ncbi:MAG: hypothetical protein V3S47_01545 [Acidobacteriota bacterium]
MLRSESWFFMLAVLWIGLIGCGGDPQAPETPVEMSSTSFPEAQLLEIPTVGEDSDTVRHEPLIWDVPAGWTEEVPSSGMRLTQYTVPGSGGDGECVVFYFGPGQGGDPLANARRWAGQFNQPDGSSSLDKMTMQELDGAAMGLTLVEVTGIYSGGMTMDLTPATPKPGWMLLGGIAAGPDAPWFFKLTGPQATLEENRDAFVVMLRSIRQEI